MKFTLDEMLESIKKRALIEGDLEILAKAEEVEKTIDFKKNLSKEDIIEDIARFSSKYLDGLNKFGVEFMSNEETLASVNPSNYVKAMALVAIPRLAANLCISFLQTEAGPGEKMDRKDKIEIFKRFLDTFDTMLESTFNDANANNCKTHEITPNLKFETLKDE